MTAAKIYKHDTSGAIVDSLDSPGLYPSGLAHDGTAWWNADAFGGKIYSLDITKGLIATSLYAKEDMPIHSSGIAYDGKDLWVSLPIGLVRSAGLLNMTRPDLR